MQSKTLKIISSLLLGIILLVVMTGCGNSDTTVEQATGTATSAVPADTTASTTEPTPETVTVTDSSGREVTVKLPVERVSYLHPTVAEGLRIIDAWDRVVSVDNYTTDSILFPGFTDMPVITYTESGDVDYEAIIELKPDVLLVLAVGGTIDLAEVAATLEPEITVIGVFDTYDADTWTEGIELLGTILQQENEAREFIEFANAIENNISTRTAAIPDGEKPGVFLKVPGWTEEQFSTFTDEFGFVQKMMVTTGAINVAADLPSMGGWVQEVDMEWLMTQTYEYILVQVYDDLYPGLVGLQIQDDAAIAAYREELKNLDAFSGSVAVDRDNVYLMDSYFMCTPRYFILMEYLAQSLHPELFPELDPRATLQEYLARFIRIDFALDSSGVFFYPES